jgi:acyl-[acyl-carrier-protein]-phospholipid O-acyltransferase/long-chain-fatty-acid--[acyl-carrier-protein] ligase
MSLFLSRRFFPLFITQFLGAFNDNLFKNALVMLVVFKVASHEGALPGSVLVPLAGALFILPYFLFSATAGQLADKYDRARISRITKVWEVIVVIVAAIGFVGHHPNFLLFMLFALGTQATFFGPVKYALLPQHLADDELLAGNAYIEAGNFLAILLGTIAGGVLVVREGGEWLIVMASAVVAIAGYITSRFIPKAPAPVPDLTIGFNIFKETWKIVSFDRKIPRVFRSIVAISWFWLVGAVYLSQFPTYAKETLFADEGVVTLFLTSFSLGIGVGSILSNILAKGKITSRYVPGAALCLSVFSIDLYFASGAGFGVDAATLMSVSEFLSHGANLRILFDLCMVAVSGGVYIVPLYAIMQHESDVNNRARTIASNNVLNAIFIVLSAIATIGMVSIGAKVGDIFLTLGVLNLGAALYTYRLSKLKHSS